MNFFSFIIGIAGKKRVGKDTAGTFIQKNFDYTPYAIATPLKQCIGALMGFDRNNLYGDSKDQICSVYEISPRFVLQIFGTEIMRNRFTKYFPTLKIFCENFWTRRLLKTDLNLYSKNKNWEVKYPPTCKNHIISNFVQILFGFTSNEMINKKDEFWYLNPLEVVETFKNIILPEFFKMIKKNESWFWEKRFQMNADDYLVETLTQLDKKIVLTDVRFSDEFYFLKHLNFDCILITRITPQDNHISENSLNNIDFKYNIDNNGTLENFQKEIIRIITAVLSSYAFQKYGSIHDFIQSIWKMCVDNLIFEIKHEKNMKRFIFTKDGIKTQEEMELDYLVPNPRDVSSYLEDFERFYSKSFETEMKLDFQTPFYQESLYNPYGYEIIDINYTHISIPYKITISIDIVDQCILPIIEKQQIISKSLNEKKISDQIFDTITFYKPEESIIVRFNNTLLCSEYFVNTFKEVRKRIYSYDKFKINYKEKNIELKIYPNFSCIIKTIKKY